MPREARESAERRLYYVLNDDGLYNRGYRIYDGTDIFADTFTEDAAKEIVAAVFEARRTP